MRPLKKVLTRKKEIKKQIFSLKKILRNLKYFKPLFACFLHITPVYIAILFVYT
jgi:hypothetical protein